MKSITVHCPSCGKPIAARADLKWNARDRTLTGPGISTTFGVVATAIFDMLWQSRGRHGVTTRDIAAHVYASNGGPETAENMIRKSLFIMRKRIAPFGLTIGSGRGNSALHRLIDVHQPPPTGGPDDDDQDLYCQGGKKRRSKSASGQSREGKVEQDRRAG